MQVKSIDVFAAKQAVKECSKEVKDYVKGLEKEHKRQHKVIMDLLKRLKENATSNRE